MENSKSEPTVRTIYVLEVNESGIPGCENRAYQNDGEVCLDEQSKTNENTSKVPKPAQVFLDEPEQPILQEPAQYRGVLDQAPPTSYNIPDRISNIVWLTKTGGETAKAGCRFLFRFSFSCYSGGNNTVDVHYGQICTYGHSIKFPSSEKWSIITFFGVCDVTLIQVFGLLSSFLRE